jgi:hypothetical protein
VLKILFSLKGSQEANSIGLKHLEIKRPANITPIPNPQPARPDVLNPAPSFCAAANHIK